ncbi:putative damage-inducible protein DinB [Bradyrhizobium japonicum]|uniref:Damage-inducible protein DinB n=2 Tax=Bradyrhizobium japonicum TaxID=375 RepID=A0ABV2RS49_BRAJP
MISAKKRLIARPVRIRSVPSQLGFQFLDDAVKQTCGKRIGDFALQKLVTRDLEFLLSQLVLCHRTGPPANLPGNSQVVSLQFSDHLLWFLIGKGGAKQVEGFAMSIVQTYRAFAYNNAWANHRLHRACAELGQGEFEVERTSFFPSLQRTLNHIYVVDLLYVDALEGGWLGPKAWEDPIPFPALAGLSEAQASIDRRFIGVCDALTPASLNEDVRINRDPGVQIERRDRLLMHLIQHHIHHRGQAHTMLSGTRVKPPQLDEFFSAAEAPLRASEFADLGWTEETVWGPPN